MFEQRTIIDQIEITRDGEVRLRLDKQLLRDGKVISEPRFHRAAWEPGADFEGTIAALNSHLEAMREAAVDAGEWARVREVIAQQHKPEVIARWRAKREADTSIDELESGVTATTRR